MTSLRDKDLHFKGSMTTNQENHSILKKNSSQQDASSKFSARSEKSEGNHFYKKEKARTQFLHKLTKKETQAYRPSQRDLEKLQTIVTKRMKGQERYKVNIIPAVSNVSNSKSELVRAKSMEGSDIDHKPEEEDPQSVLPLNLGKGLVSLLLGKKKDKDNKDEKINALYNLMATHCQRRSKRSKSRDG